MGVSLQVVRVLFSGAEMVSRLIISDAETRDFARQMPAAYMLLPHERIFGNDTVLSLGTGAGWPLQDMRLVIQGLCTNHYYCGH